MKKYDAYLIGNYGTENTAEDAILAATVWGCRHYFDYDNMLIANAGTLCEKRFGEQPTNIMLPELLPGQNRFNHYINAMQCKSVIFGGDTSLINYRDINLKRMLMRLTGRKKAKAIGIGLEPFKDSESELACRRFLMECGFVSVRDQLSYDIATFIAPDANVYRAADLAPCLVRDPDYAPQERKRSGIVFNVCPLEVNARRKEGSDPYRHIEHIANVMETVWLLTQTPISVISFANGKVTGDTGCISKLQEILRDKVPFDYIPYNPDPIQVLKTISEFKLMVGMRLHANIFAYLSETPTLNIGYTRSNFEWAYQVKMKESYVYEAEDLDQPRLVKLILDILHSGKSGSGVAANHSVLNALQNWRFAVERSPVKNGLPLLSTA